MNEQRMLNYSLCDLLRDIFIPIESEVQMLNVDLRFMTIRTNDLFREGR